MKQGNTNTLRLLVVALAVLIIFAAYRFAVVPANEKTDALKEDSEKLTNEIRIFDVEEKNRAKYEEGIKQSPLTAFALLERYGGGTSTEKTIMNIVNLEKYTGMAVSSVSFGLSTNLYSTDKLAYGDNKPGVFMYCQPVSLTYAATYESLKKAVDYINTYPERMNIDSLTASYDMLTGQLSGSLVINVYSVIGGKNEYVVPATDATIPVGTDNIFGTYELPSDEPEEGDL